jgi:hypothetical protein
LLRFVSDDIWGSRGRCRVISRSIAEYLVQAWDVRNSCKHNEAVLPLPSAPEGRGADGVDAMAWLGNMMMMTMVLLLASDCSSWIMTAAMLRTPESV